MIKGLRIIAGVAFAVVLAGCNVKFYENVVNLDNIPDSIIGGFKYLSLNPQGRKEWELKASNAKMFTEKDEVYLFNMTMTMYNEENQIESFVSGDYGFVDKISQDVVIEGHVKILSDNEVMMECNKVYWKNDEKLFYSETNDLVTLTRGRTVVHGYNMTADTGLEEVILENTTANVHQEDAEAMEDIE